MNDLELNKRLAEWAGFTHKFGGEWFYEKYKSTNAWWEAPNGRKFYKLPVFTQSLDADFEWLVPNFPPGIRIRMLGQLRNGKGYFCSIGGSFIAHYYSEAETPALAVCLALEKLIDAEVK